MVCGTFFALGNMDNHFLHIFSNLETLIRSISPGGAGGPLLPTQLIQSHTHKDGFKNLPSSASVV